MRLTGRTMLITGGSSGIGFALAQKFVELGNEVIITGRREEKLAAAVKAQPKLKTLCSDVGDLKAIEELGREVTCKYPKLDVLINNAGMMVLRNLRMPSGDLAALTSEIDVNLAGPIRMVAALIERLKANKGTIINISSAAAFVPMHAAPIYSATKAALHAYTTSLRQLLGDDGVEVIELMPAAVKTELVHFPEDMDFVKVISTAELIDKTIYALSAGRLEIRPGQANISYLLSRLAPELSRSQFAKIFKRLVP